jgi:predicted nucleic acid-binding protein
LNVLIDTSAWVEALRKDGNPAIQSQVKHVLLSGEGATCAMVMLELWNGAHGEYERSQLRRFGDAFIFLSIDEAVWKESWDFAQACRTNGLTIPSTDLLIIAVALHHNAEIIHSDKHFDMYFASL